MKGLQGVDRVEHRRVRTGWVLVTVFITAGVLLAIPIIQAFRDTTVVWDSVRFPQGNVGTVVPDAVHPGDKIIVTFKEYCNDGVDVRNERWLDLLGPGGAPVAAFALPDLEFYPTGPSCLYDVGQPVTIPDYLTGRLPGDVQVRLRTDTVYQKPRQTPHVDSFSEPFTLLAEDSRPATLKPKASIPRSSS